MINCTEPASRLKKKHLGCSYHRIRELVAAGVIELMHVGTKENLSDMLTRALSGPQLRSAASRILEGFDS